MSDAQVKIGYRDSSPRFFNMYFTETDCAN